MKVWKRTACFFALVLIVLNSNIGLGQENPHKNLAMECESCHISTTWNRVRFNHNTTKFSLEDRHQEVKCNSCHNIEDFSQVSTQCFTCHEDIHQAKMGGDCEKCHTFQGWEIFNVEEIHADTQFPLMGRHTLVDCQSCHQNQLQGDFALLTTDCISCHQQDYLAVENPNHVANSFSTDCQECHDMNSFQPAFLPNHDIFFPIFSGEHDGAWNECQDCHQNPATFTDFTCLVCHEHRQPKMDEKHQGIPGYAYESTACLSCHPTGDEGGFADHDNLFFPIFSGTHNGAWDDCLICHTNPANRQEFTCLQCHEHRQEEMDPKHAGIPGYAYESSQCYFCHPAGEKGDFVDHDNLYFPIFSGAHKPEKWDTCETCHFDSNNRQLFTCVTCHEHNQSKMDEKHLGKVPGYMYESTACYDCHPNGKS